MNKYTCIKFDVCCGVNRAHHWLHTCTHHKNIKFNPGMNTPLMNNQKWNTGKEFLAVIWQFLNFGLHLAIFEIFRRPPYFHPGISDYQ